MRTHLLAALLAVAAVSACRYTPPERADLAAPEPDLALAKELDLPERPVATDGGAAIQLCEGVTAPDNGDGGAPSFGPTVAAKRPPPPVSGGTLLATRDGSTFVAADPDRDRIWLVDAKRLILRASVALLDGSEPGRVAEDGAGHLHVVLRRAGQVVTIDAQGNLLEARPVCGAPRGIAWDARTDRVHVACADGELVSLPAAGGVAVRALRLDPDLRDVVVDGKQLLVSRFREAELLAVADDGTVTARLRPPRYQNASVRGGEPFDPAVAWRTIAHPSGGAVMLHQRGQASPIALAQPFVPDGDGGAPPMETPYGGVGFDPCSSVVHAAVTALAPGAKTLATPVLPIGALPVDAAIAPNGLLWVVSAGQGHRAGLAGIALPLQVGVGPDLGCGKLMFGGILGGGEAIAIAAAPDGTIAVQLREPAALRLQNGVTVALVAGASVADTGHAVFHSDSGKGIACASCHPEGGEDGRTWLFDIGARRTKSLRGGIAGRAPFHWSGDLADLDHLFGEVFVRRMGGPALACDQLEALERWLDAIPHLPPPADLDPAAVARGAALFADPNVGCATCHSGKLFTDDAHVDVGTGDAFQVPSLRGVAWRAPYLHDGCAPTLADRFGPCGGPRHGATAQLAPSEIDDLVAYLRSL